MVGEHVCLKEQDWGRLWEILKTYSGHVIEGDKVGGFRDRLLKVEYDVKENEEKSSADMKSLNRKIDAIGRGRWTIGIISGIVGALIGSGSKDIVGALVKWFLQL